MQFGVYTPETCAGAHDLAEDEFARAGSVDRFAARGEADRRPPGVHVGGRMAALAVDDLRSKGRPGCRMRARALGGTFIYPYAFQARRLPIITSIVPGKGTGINGAVAVSAVSAC